jgi:hypothetical protein
MAFTDIDNPELFFQIKLYTGNGSTQSITLDGDENMQPDFVWVKDRGRSGYNHVLNDSVRGVTKYVRSNLTNDEDTYTDAITAFDSNGFTLGSDSSNGEHNVSSQTYVSWNWKAGGSASSNSNGSITSSVSANTTAGFSIVSYTGNGTSGTIGHGLGSVPQMLIVKNRTDSAHEWKVYHHTLGNNKRLHLDDTSAVGTTTAPWNATTPTSSVFSVGGDGGTNDSSDSMIAYCFANVKGYSKFGSYEGNGNADGTFVYTGFKPAWVMTKSIDTTSNWEIKDNKRSTFNTIDDYIKANANAAEDTGVSSHAMDFLSNGFKHRGSNDEVNGSETYIYMAFAESPFVNSNGVPNNAR